MTVDTTPETDPDVVGDVAESVAAESVAAEPDRVGDAAAAKKPKKKKKKKARAELVVPEPEPEATPASKRAQLVEHLDPRRHPVVSGLAAVCVVAVVAAIVFGALFFGKSASLADVEQLNADKQAAESVAGTYAVDAATFNHDDIPAWAALLKKGTAPELNSRFDVAVKTLTPLIQEVQWTQTAKLIAAKTVEVRSGRQFVVQVFVSTQMTSTQNPAGLNTVTPYTVTLDRDDNWLITDVAGIAGAAQDGSSGSGTPDLSRKSTAATPATTAPATPTP